MFGLKSSGDWSKTMNYLARVQQKKHLDNLHSYGREGVRALSSATPVDSGETSISWDYEIVRTPSRAQIIWTNSNVNNGITIAVLIQYGHGTGTGGYVQGRDYINPAMRVVFDKIADNVWREVTRG